MLLSVFSFDPSKVYLGAFLIFAVVLFWSLTPPRHPRNAPSIPFWVVLLPFFCDVDQENTYRKYIQKPLQEHGVVKIFFGGHWNLLVQKPNYLLEIFKNEELYQKTGNQKKIPHSVLADFLGDNIISARDENWRLYQNVMKPGLQANFQAEPIIMNARKLCTLLRDSQRILANNGVPVQEAVQRYTIANISKALLQMDTDALTNRDARINQLQLAVKKEIFQPVFMNFPVLDRLGALIPSRVRARRLVEDFSKELQTQLTQNHKGVSCSLASDKLGYRLLAARDSGVLSQKQFRDNLTVTFVAGQENPQLSLISMLYLLGKHTDVQARLRQEIATCGANEPSPELVQSLPYLNSVIFECLRLFPPISQLINRRVSESTLLGGEIFIPKGTYVGYHSYSTNRDPEVWGKTANNFEPERWGQVTEEISKRYRRVKARAEFVSFHGGKRACLGEKFALLELRISLFIIVQNFIWILDPKWPDRKTPAGPLYPRGLRLCFTDLKE